MTKFPSIRDQLLDRLEGMASGEPFPPERQLAESLGVSRMTLRRAIDELVVRGLVCRRPGAGVFALGPKLNQPLTASSFSEDMAARGMRPSSRILEFDSAAAGPRIARRLEIAESDIVTVVLRLRLADDEPIALEKLHTPEALVPRLSPEDLAISSFYELLTARYGIQLASGTQTIEPTLINGLESEVLDVPEGSPALLFERTSRSAEGKPCEFVSAVYRGDRYKIRTELSMPPQRGGEHR